MIKRKFIVGIMAMLMSLSFIGCEESSEEALQLEDTESQTEEDVVAEEEAEVVAEPENITEINAEDIFDNEGYYGVEITEDCIIEATVSQTAKDNNVTWIAYVREGEFDDVPRFIPQDTAALKDTVEINAETGSEIEATKGDYVYFYCSENSFTCDSKDSLTADDILTYTITTK